VWACILQFISFANTPQSFHIWNSILTVILFIAAILYPVIMFLILRNNANSLTDTTFGLAYE
jgi:phosphotransferase system  glucose/maltose/N-acetylglucosamine-specific IIC component